ncbi:MAG TPA: hypothetical protein VJJ76_01155 [archaeon]|nr:hypothetical protein [archaeon]
MSLDKFRKVYSLLPDSEKKLTIIVIDNQKYSWEEAYNEIVKNSDIGKTIQKKLEKLNII